MSLAQPGDLPAVMALLGDRIKWLRERNSDQWNAGRPFESRMADAISRQTTWLLRDENDPIGTITLSSKGDRDFWTQAELADRALYLGKMATSTNRMGESLGRVLITWAQDWAAQSGFDLLRWDVWRTNKQLQRYYRSLGARYLRTENVAHRWSGALFELETKRVPDLDATVITEAPAPRT
jgi:GNAT superfamily N-acetyltransferase